MPEKKENKYTMFGNKRNLIFIILIFVGVTIFFIINSSNNGFIPFTVKDDSFIISGSKEYSFTINIADVDTITLSEIPDMGECIEDHSTRKYNCGTYKNDTYGTYEACLLKKIKRCIEITTKDGNTYVFNYESRTATEELYKAILEYKDK